jgi:hypothetical protein
MRAPTFREFSSSPCSSMIHNADAAAEGLADGHDVGPHAGMLDAPAAPRPTEAGDHFVGNQ